MDKEQEVRMHIESCISVNEELQQSEGYKPIDLTEDQIEDVVQFILAIRRYDDMMYPFPAPNGSILLESPQSDVSIEIY